MQTQIFSPIEPWWPSSLESYIISIVFLVPCSRSRVQKRALPFYFQDIVYKMDSTRPRTTLHNRNYNHVESQTSIFRIDQSRHPMQLMRIGGNTQCISHAPIVTSVCACASPEKGIFRVSLCFIARLCYRDIA